MEQTKLTKRPRKRLRARTGAEDLADEVGQLLKLDLPTLRKKWLAEENHSTLCVLGRFALSVPSSKVQKGIALYY